MKTTFAKRVCRFTSLIYSFMLIGFLISCSADLGKFDMNGNFVEYYETFGDVSGIYDDNKSVAKINYDFKKSIFNDYIAEKLKWENEEDKVLYKEYCYIVIPFKQEMKIESLALYVSKDSSVEKNINLEFSAFYFRDESEVPQNIKLLSSDDTRIVEKDDGNGGTIEVEEEIEYDDPQKENRNCFSNIVVNKSFDGFMLERFSQINDGKGSYVSDNCLNVKEGSFLYLRCENNSGLNRDRLTPCAFSFMNLLVRKV